MNKFKAAFDNIKADEELKTNTKAYVFNELNKRNQKHFSYRHLISISCSILIFLFSYWLFLIPTIEIDIDINPSIELRINRFDKVIYAKGNNQDGSELLEGIKTNFVDYDEVVDQIISEQVVSDLLNKDGVLTISVVGNNENQNERVLNDMEEHSQRHHNVECYTLKQADSKNAHNLGMSCGKYHQYQILLQYDSSITPSQVSNMTMREIKDLIIELANEHPEIENSSSDNTHHNGHHHQHQNKCPNNQ